MGCGKSKHDVIATTTVVKSMKSDNSTETHTTKKVTEKVDSLGVQQEVETKTLVVENNKTNNIATTKDPADSGDAKTDNVAPTLAATPVEDIVRATKDEKVKESSPTKNEVKYDSVVPTLSEDVVAVTEVVKEDETDKESTPTDTNEAKTDNVDSTVNKDDVATTKVVKDDVEVKDSKKENAESVISEEKYEKTVDVSTNPEEETPKVEEQMNVVPVEESTKEETKKEEDVEVTGVNIANAEASSVAEPEKVPNVDEVNAIETTEKEPETK